MGKLFTAALIFCLGIMAILLGGIIQLGVGSQPIQGDTWIVNLLANIIMLAGILNATICPVLLIKDYCNGK